ncbi:MAG: hypothetical protein MI924_22190 [Chloroflexales bacterium]|nr:hypothetical protein [Chloroflexales bacterium]
MRRGLLSLLIVFIAVAASVSPTNAVRAQFQGLKPGEHVEFTQDIPINLVFVGYHADQIDETALRAELPATYKPVVRYPRFYGVTGRDMGLQYTYRYNIINADAGFTDDFFTWLGQQGEVDEPTLYQQCYSGTAPPRPSGAPNPCNQTGNVRTIAETRYIDAPATEAWLTQQGTTRLRLSPRSYTVFFINWYNRDDFQFHVYTKTDEPDPDTGYNFGELRDSRKMIAWGGQFGRTWFFDPSAGPEVKSGSYDITNDDLDGDGELDYRIPPIWEYATDGYRDPSALSSDLGKLTRFTAVNLLFTSSPIYDPLVTTPDLGGAKVVHNEILQDDPQSDGLEYIDGAFILSKMKAFQPYYNWQSVVEETNPIDPGAQRTFRIYNRSIAPGPDDCSTLFGTPSAQPFCYFDANLSAYVPAYGPADYVMPVLALNTTDEHSSRLPLGFAEDNWRDGAQTYIFAFDSPGIRESGYGFSTTIVHEVGHHIGMSHPHDGYDSELDIDYGPSGDYYFAWSGDETNSMMSYIDLNWDFGKFDQDNVYRWEMAGYLNQANALLDDILAHPDADKVARLLVLADRNAARAQAHFDRWQYLVAVSRAYAAYLTVAAAAEELGIETQAAEPLRIAPIQNVPRMVDPIR